MEIAKLTSKGQITIPKSVRTELRVDTGDKLIFIKCEQGYLICNGDNFNIPAVEAGISAEELDDIRAGAVSEAMPAPVVAAETGRVEEERLKKADKSDKDKKKKKKKKK